MLASISRLVIRYRSSFEGLPQTSFVLTGIVFLNSVGTMVSTFLAIYLLTTLQLADTWIGYIVAAYGAGAVVGSFVGGWVCGCLAPRSIMVGSLIGTGIGILILSEVGNPWQFFILICATGCFEGSFRPALMVLLLGNASKEDRPRCFALYQTALHLGGAIGAAVGGAIALVSFKLIFWIDSLTCFIAAALLISFVQEGRRRVSKGSPDEHSGSQSLRHLNASFFILCTLIALVYVVFFQRLSTYPLFLTSHYGLEASDFGNLMMLSGLLLALSAVFAADQLKSVDQQWVAAAGGLLLCSGFALLPTSDEIVVALVSCIAMTIGQMLFVPSVASMMYSFSPKGHPGAAIGIFYAINSTCRALGPLLGVWLIHAFGYAFLWLACGIVGLLWAIILPKLPIPGRSQVP